MITEESFKNADAVIIKIGVDVATKNVAYFVFSSSPYAKKSLKIPFK